MSGRKLINTALIENGNLILINNVIRFPYEIIFRPYQKDLFKQIFDNNVKRMIVCWHRRAGKTFTDVSIMSLAAITKVGAYGIIGPTRAQVKKILFDNVDSQGKAFADYFPPPLIKKFNKVDLVWHFVNGSTLQLFSAEQYDKMRGLNLSGVLFMEYAKCDSNAWPRIISPMLRENKGWVIFESTMFGKNHFYQLKEKVKDNDLWYVSDLTVEDTVKNDGTPVYSKEDMEEEALTVHDSVIRAEYYNDPHAGVEGAIYQKEMLRLKKENRLKKFAIDKTIPVHTFWDIGVRDPTAIIFMQRVHDEMRIVHYYEITQTKFSFILSEMLDWRTKNGIILGRHFVPHDAANRNEELGTRYDVARESGILLEYGWGGGRVPSQRVQYENALSLFDRIHIRESEETERLEACLLQYHLHYYESADVLGDVVHDWSSHGCSAFQIMCWVEQKNINNPHKAKILYDRVGQSAAF